MAQGRPGRKREREFLTQLKASFLERGVFFFKIPDMPHFKGAQFRFDIPKPFDAIANYAGQAFVIEAKVTSRFKSFTLKDLRPSQIEGLEAWTRTGGKAFVFIYVWQQGRPEQCRTPIYRLLVYPWEQLRDDKRISRAQMACSRHYPRERKLKDGKPVYRFNVDQFLIDLIMS